MAVESEGCAAVAGNECRLRGEADYKVPTSFSMQDAGKITDILYFFDFILPGIAIHLSLVALWTFLVQVKIFFFFKRGFSLGYVPLIIMCQLLKYFQ